MHTEKNYIMKWRLETLMPDYTNTFANWIGEHGGFQISFYISYSISLEKQLLSHSMEKMEDLSDNFF